MNNATSPKAGMIVLNTASATDELIWDRSGFALSGGEQTSRTIKIEDEQEASTTWTEKQNTALDEYLEAHVKEALSTATMALYKLFGAYIGNALHEPGEKKQPNILDIGCGIGRRLPLYIRMLQHDVNYVGLDAIELHADRDYPFICSRFETLQKVPEFKNKFDVLIFGTSLDHFEDLDEVARTVKYLAAPGAKVVFWIGLHDMPLAASEEGARHFSKVFKNTGWFSTLIRLFGFLFWSLPRVTLALMLHRSRLERRKKIDDFHFWYFSDQDLPGLLAKFGEVSDITYVPGGGSVFTTCRIFS